MDYVAGVYEIVAPNGHRYIGSSVDLERREQDHFRALKKQKHYNPVLQKAHNKYKKRLKFKVIMYCDKDMTLFWEQKFLDNLRPEYNLVRTASGGGMSGEKCGTSKLTWDDVYEIREKYTTENYGQPQLAEEYNVSDVNISCIVRNETWFDEDYEVPDTKKIHAKNSGKANKGENCGTSKLVWDDVYKIREKYTAGNYTHAQLAKKYNVTKANISYIVSNETWFDENYEIPDVKKIKAKNVSKRWKKRKETIDFGEK